MKKRIAVTMAAIMMLSALTPPMFISECFGISAEDVTLNTSFPTGLKARISGSVLRLSWNKVSGADKYRIYIYDTEDKKYKRYTEVKGTECTLTKLSSERTYYFKVAAVKNGKVGKKSDKIKVVVGVSTKKWVNAYKGIIKEYANDKIENAVWPACSLYDVTGDGIPELFVSHGNAHMNGVEIYSYNGKTVKHYSHICSYNKNEKYFTFGGYGEVYYCPERKCLIDMMMGQGILDMTVFTFANGDIKEEVRLEDRSEFGYSPMFLINDEEVTKQKYWSTYNKYEGETVTLGQSFVIKVSDEFKDDRMSIDKVWSKILNEGWTGYDDLETNNNVSIMAKEHRYDLE